MQVLVFIFSFLGQQNQGYTFSSNKYALNQQLQKTYANKTIKYLNPDICLAKNMNYVLLMTYQKENKSVRFF